MTREVLGDEAETLARRTTDGDPACAHFTVCYCTGTIPLPGTVPALHSIVYKVPIPPSHFGISSVVRDWAYQLQYTASVRSTDVTVVRSIT